MFLGNRREVAELVVEIRDKFPNKTIWLYTGYRYDELLREKENDKDLNMILHHIDVLLDGKFVLKLASEKIHYVGSSNQEIIDVPKSLKENRKILYIDNNKIIEGEV